jgi:hypothetical protein
MDGSIDDAFEGEDNRSRADRRQQRRRAEGFSAINNQRTDKASIS